VYGGRALLNCHLLLRLLAICKTLSRPTQTLNLAKQDIKRYRTLTLTLTRSIFPFDAPYDTPYPANPHKYRHNPYIITKYSLCATFPPLVVWVYLHSNFSCGLRKAGAKCYRVNYCPSRSSKVINFGTNRKHVYIFLLVIYSNLDHILHRFRDTVA